MVNATASEAKRVPNIPELINDKKLIDRMEFENFLSPEATKEYHRTGLENSTALISATKHRKLWKPNQLRTKTKFDTELASVADVWGMREIMTEWIKI